MLVDIPYGKPNRIFLINAKFMDHTAAQCVPM